jgi:hypothetical protein
MSKMNDWCIQHHGMVCNIHSWLSQAICSYIDTMYFIYRAYVGPITGNLFLHRYYVFSFIEPI